MTDAMLDAFECYELCVQSPRHVTAFLRVLHGNEPVVLREDFCGTAALGVLWCEEAMRRGEHAGAVCVDLDDGVMARAATRAEDAGVSHAVRLVRADCLGEAAPDDAADVVFVGNFSIGYIHERPALVRYLAACRGRLSRGRRGIGGGVFVCDTYGGASAFKMGGLERRHPSRGREVIRYWWLHEEADPCTAMVTNSISFRVELDGEIVAEYPRAFVYRWRLWGIAELREAMLDAGFAATEVYKDIAVAPGQAPRAVGGPEELGEDWIVLVAARL